MAWSGVSMASSPTFLRFGDAIFLVCAEGEGRFVSARGGRLGVDSSPTPPASFSQESVFVVKPQQKYVAARMLKLGVLEAGLARHREDKAMKAAEREEEMNRASCLRIAGREVRYGEVVQLHHCVTDIPIACSTDASTTALYVGSEAAGDASWFRVMPRLKIQAEGERVRLGDPLMLEHVQTSRRVRVTGGRACDPIMPDGRHEVSTTLEKAGLRVSLYRPYEELESPPPLFGGEVVRVVCREEGGYLAAIATSEQNNTTAALVAADSHDDASLDTMWFFLNADITSGAALRWGGRVWVAHAPSGRALSVAAGGRGGDEEESLAVGTIKLLPHDREVQQRGLFELVPLDSTSSGVVAADSLFRLRHVDSGRWIHFARAGSDGAREKRPSLSDMSASREEVEAMGATSILVAGALSATVASVDDNLLSLQPVPLDRYSDCLRCDKWLTTLREPSDAKALGRVAGELIRFVTVSDNPDPFTREGLPHAARQLLLRQRGVLDLTIAAVQAPLNGRIISADDLLGGRTPAAKELNRALSLCMVLFRHLLRSHDANKGYAMRFVPELQTMLGLGIRAAAALTEIFLENESALQLVTDAHVGKFLSLIRNVGRQARFIEFLIVLCQCNGLAICVNQWRICRLLLSESPELLPSLSVAPTASKAAPKVIISGDATYFPFIKEGSKDLVEWLQQEHIGSSNDPKGPVGYFESCLSLFAALVEGGNLRNGPALRERLPYDLLATMLTDERLRRVKTRPDGRAVGLGICARVASIIRALYVDAEPHQLMASVTHIRIWDNVPEVSQKGVLSSRSTSKRNIDWEQFDPLKAFLAIHIAKFDRMDATMLVENRVLVELLRLLHALIKLGFYVSSELVPLLPSRTPSS